MKMNKDIYSIPQAAAYCLLNRGTLWKYVKRGELKASLTPGGQYRIRKKDLESFVRRKGMYPLANYQPPSKKILIVDDDPLIQAMLTQMLSIHKYTTEVASDGFAAGIKVTEFKPGLVILDLIMPGMDGFEVCWQIKQNSGTSQIKVLAITGYDTKENKDRIMEAGADGYLTKPIAMGTLLQHVENLLNETSRRSGAEFKNHNKL